MKTFSQSFEIDVNFIPILYFQYSSFFKGFWVEPSAVWALTFTDEPQWYQIIQAPG